eukprot:TRINITY_DN110924_c0_g1_i1.p1 TRINITY_DN110924_c0_g1~~TRINITY_DN110924_c0_g1_i1.p1  ORF type:complete len:1029 (-),score=269.92 TRINITY_DN110924_c0_g1_i1:273-3359(-)
MPDASATQGSNGSKGWGNSGSAGSSSQKLARPSAATASTATPRTSAATPRTSAAQPLMSGISDPVAENSLAPELTTSSRSKADSGFYTPGLANLAPRQAAGSLVRSICDAPAGHDEARLTGLTTARAQELLDEFGRNEIPEEITPWYIMLGRQFVGLMPFMLWAAAILSAIGSDWADFGIIMTMLIVNGLIGFHEEHKAQQSLDALKAEMSATVPTKRDGNMVILPIAELVPGDIIFLRGGNIVPADSEWLEGDPMLVDTACLTGEPLPRKVPRPDKEGEAPGAGRLLLSGCIIKQGEGHCEVKETGLRTEIGQAAGLVQEASGHNIGVFESKIMQVVRAVILVTLLDAGVVLYVNIGARDMEVRKALIGVLALVIGAVPIALPLVMQVTMAMGAKKMAEKKAIVTHLTALQEIASMTVLCSDKTGTLTTANMRIIPQRVWVGNGYKQDDALVWAGVASNPANKEDPIDKAVLASVHEYFGEQQGASKLAEYTKTKFVGFNPTVKRTVAYCTHPEHGELKLAKGLVDKVLSTGDDGGDCWEVTDLSNILEEVKAVDYACSVQGYKTVGVACARGSGPMKFVGIVPMLDPPREDTMLTIHRIRTAGINVKMITGDHLNIAIETSRLIGLGTGVLPATDLWPASASRDEVILNADGFAQVLPKDKREVVLVLQNRGLVVGMTGDGVNDAPALAQAQIGIAVDDATEAARSAADIVLTSPGLSAIFDAVAESRMIFARLRAYVLYRLAATIQIVLVLSFLIYGYAKPLPALYVILLALLNDVTMLPIAADNASPSALPEIPSMPQILLASTLYGALETAQTLIFYASGWLQHVGEDDEDDYRAAVVYLQISIAIEFLILSCRTPGFVLSPQSVWGKSRPSLALFLAVMAANVLVSVLAYFGVLIYKVAPEDIAWIWVYDVAWLVAIDFIKVVMSAVRLPWLSAGAAGGLLEYVDLPAEDMARQGSAVQSHMVSHRSTLMNTRSSARSMARRVSGQESASGSMVNRGRTSSSLLPYPYNLRAAATQDAFRSF